MVENVTVGNYWSFSTQLTLPLHWEALKFVDESFYRERDFMLEVAAHCGFAGFCYEIERSK